MRARACAVWIAVVGAAACSGPRGVPGRTEPRGRWTSGDLHIHTMQSNDAQVPLRAVLEAAFDTYRLDWVALSNHLRVSDRDHEGTAIPGGPVPLSRGLALYEIPFVAALQAGG